MSEMSMSARAMALLRGERWGRAANRGFWTLTDRSLFALSNFALNVTLARWMNAEAYGAFAIAFSIFLILGGLQSTLLVGPLLVFGPKRYKERFQTYLGVVIKGHMALSALTSVCLALAGGACLAWGSSDIGHVLLALAVSAPFILLLWLLRLSCYVRIQTRQTTIAGAVYLVLLLTGTYLLHRLSFLTPTSALLLMAATSLVVAIWLGVRQGAKLFDERLRSKFALEVATEHWCYARWTIPTRLMKAGYRNMVFFILPYWGGLEATGALRALMNLTMPMGFIEHSLAVVMVPTLVRARANGTLHEKVILAIAFFFVTSFVYGIALVVFQDQIIQLLYGGRYGSYADLVWVIALIPVIGSVSIVIDSTLRAIERPKDIFWAILAGALVGFTFGIGAVIYAGAFGAVISLLLSASVSMILMLVLLRSALRSEKAEIV